ncbi:hypothetical protein [Anaeromyxobacter oryzae]|uniref:Uncharacterized protein n=1 Tax=Anaeromyxobacter oryzae TaxID=2918170 RepID=A0ABM7WXI6_9BACT|nr:hypothetical protein [Anaeromyxobacter oryzae]BDG04204.1 hypothetical protein AMOR_32000 [Anaeromyxobacter oryzae]
MSKLAALAALTITLAAGRALAEDPPYAGSQDDASYPIDARRSAWAASGGAGSFEAGTPSDDTAYPTPAPGAAGRASAYSAAPRRTFVPGTPSDDTTYPATTPAAASSPVQPGPVQPGMMAGSPAASPARSGTAASP